MKVSYEYSPYKAIHYLSWLKEVRLGKILSPIHIQMSPTNRCNHQCTFCAYRIPEYPSSELFNPHHEIPIDAIRHILNSAGQSGSRALQITGGGEPLVHPQIEQILETAVSVGLSLSLVSNGSKLSSTIADFLAREASWVRLSLDAGTPQIHRHIHGASLGDWDRILLGLQTLVDKKKEYRAKVIIGVGFVVAKGNIEDIVACTSLAKEIGADNIRFSMAFTGKRGGGITVKERNKAINGIRESKRLSTDSFHVFDFFPSRIVDSFKDVQDYGYCAAKDLAVYIGADQVLYSCCTLAYNKRGAIGSLENATIMEVMNSEGGRRFRENHVPAVICRNSCMYREKNELALYMLMEDPPHVEFV